MEKVPLSSIWNTGGPTIQFINKGDFEMEDLLERLGLTRSKLAKSFGSVDREEIVSRQELVRLLWEDQRLLDWCADYRKLIPDASLLMTDPDTFLRDFNPELPSTPYI